MNKRSNAHGSAHESADESRPATRRWWALLARNWAGGLAIPLAALLACGGDVSHGGATGALGEDIVVQPPVWCQYGNACFKTTASGCSATGDTVVSSCPTLPSLAWPSSPVTSAGNDARLPGSGSVGADGQYHYTIPLDIPAGRMGMGPSLALSYSSDADDGVLGVGWAIGPQSGIMPCPQTLATNGAAVPVKMDGTDKLCLDGQQLIDISANGDGSLFTTEQDGFAQITKVQPSALGAIASTDVIQTPAYKVVSPAGVTSIYKQYGPASRPATHWLLDRVTDSNGNSVYYSYNDLHQDSLPGLTAQVAVWECSLNFIRYTDRVTTSAGAVTGVSNGERKVQFNYGTPATDSGQALPPPVVQRYGGIPTTACSGQDGGTQCPIVATEVRVSQQLQSIDVWAPTPSAGTSTQSNLVWSYAFGYTQSTATNRDLLANVQKVTPGGASTLTRQFTYDQRSGLDFTNDWVNTHVLTTIPNVYPPSLYGDTDAVADINNDGIAEVLQDSGTLAVAPSYVAGATPDISALVAAGVSLKGANIVDTNGDGVPEFVAATQTSPGFSTYYANGVAIPSDPDRQNASGAPSWGSAGGVLYDQQVYLGAGYVPTYPANNNSVVVYADLSGSGLPWQMVFGSQFNVQSEQAYFTLAAVNGQHPLLSSTSLYDCKYPCTLGQYPLSSFHSALVNDGSGASVLWSLGDVPGEDWLRNPLPGDGAGPTWLGLGANGTIWQLGPTLDIPSTFVAASESGGTIPLTAIGFGSSALPTEDAGVDASAVATEQLGAMIVGNFDGRSSQEEYQIPAGVYGLGGDLTDWAAQSFDVDGDGRDDVVLANVAAHDQVYDVDNAAKSEVYLIRFNTDGSVIAPVPMPFMPLAEADMNGDGLNDFIAIDTTTQNSNSFSWGTIFIRQNAAHDRLVSVSDSGMEGPYLEQVTYTQNLNGNVHGTVPGFQTNTPIACAYPVHCIPSGMTVVLTRSVYQGADVNAVRTFQYAYSGPRSDMRGRGFLGFTAVEEEDLTRGSETVTTYDNVTSNGSGAYYAFLPQTRTVTVPLSFNSSRAGSGNVRQTVTQYDYMSVETHSSVSGQQTYAFQLYSEQTAEYEAMATISSVQWGMPSRFTMPPSMTPLRTHETTYGYDSYGNTTCKLSVTSGATWPTLQPCFGNGSAVAVASTVAGNATLTTRTTALAGGQYPVVVQSEQTSTWMPSQQQNEAIPAPRTVNYQYNDAAHPGLPSTIIDNQGASDPTVPSATTVVRSVDGVVTSTSTIAYDPTGGAPTTQRAPFTTAPCVTGGTCTQACPWNSSLTCEARTTTVQLDPDEGMFPRVTTNPLGFTLQTLVHPTFGVPLDAIDENYVVTQTTVDDFGRTRSVTAGPNPTVATTYSQRIDLAQGLVVGTNVMTAVNGLSNQSWVSYDLLGRPVATQTADFSGNGSVDVTNTTYDALGRVTFSSRPYNVAAGGSTELTGVSATPGAGTSYTYDPLDRMLSSLAPDPVSPQPTVYTPAFLGVTVTDPMGHTSGTLTDLDGRLVNSTRTLHNATGQSQATGAVVTTYAYGSFDELLSTTDSNGNVVQNTYDAAGRRITLQDPDLGTETTAYNGFGEVVTDSHVGTPCAPTSGTALCLGPVTSNAGTGVPANTPVTISVSASVPLSSGFAIDIADEGGNVAGSCASGSTCQITLSLPAVTHTYTAYVVSTAGTNVGDSLATSASPVVVSWTGSSTVPAEVPLRGSTYKHDWLGRVTTIANGEDGLSTSGNETVGTTSFGWDTAPFGVGQLASAVSPDGTWQQFTYDGYARPSWTTWILPSAVGGQYTVATVYDSFGRPATTYYPNVEGQQPVMQLNYNSLGYLTGASATIAATTQWNVWTVTARMPDGQLQTGQFGNGIVENRGYDPAGRLWSIADQLGGSSPVRQLAYNYDHEGAVTYRDDQVLGRTETFARDSLHRMAQWTLNDGGSTAQVTYNYDFLGNLLNAPCSGALCAAPQETYTYSTTVPTAPAQTGVGGIRPHALVGLTGVGGSQAFAYDDRGRQISASGARSNVTYTSFDLPRSITTASGTTQFYYDAFGNRVAKVNATSGNTTITLGGLYERRVTSNGNTDVYYLSAGDGALAQYVYNDTASSGSQEYILGDAQGSSSMVLNASGAVIGGETTDFDPFGKRIAANGAVATLPTSSDLTIGFAGLEQDDDLGLVNMNGRLYDAKARHFLTPDPMVVAPADSQSYNRYSYVRNHPLDAVDPSGFEEGDSAPPPPPPSDCDSTTTCCGDGCNGFSDGSLGIGGSSQPNNDIGAPAHEGQVLWRGQWYPAKIGNQLIQAAAQTATTQAISKFQPRLIITQAPQPLPDWASIGTADNPGGLTRLIFRTNADWLATQPDKPMVAITKYLEDHSPLFRPDNHTLTVRLGPPETWDDQTKAAAEFCASLQGTGGAASDCVGGEVWDRRWAMMVVMAASVGGPGEAGAAGEAAAGATPVEEGAASRILSFTERDLQKGFTKHGEDFGMSGNWNRSRAVDFSRAVNSFINDPAVVEISGTYRGAPVTHLFNPATGVNVIATPAGKYVSGWQLGVGQLENLFRSGAIQ